MKCYIWHGAGRSFTQPVCVCFRVCTRQKPEYPQLELHGWCTIYRAVYEFWDLPSVCVTSLLNINSPISLVKAAKLIFCVWPHISINVPHTHGYKMYIFAWTYFQMWCRAAKNSCAVFRQHDSTKSDAPVWALQYTLGWPICMNNLLE